MDRRPLGRTGLMLSPIGFGAFKIGRNVGVKYEQAYALPSDREVDDLLNGVLALGVNYVDTAPAYGTSEQRLGHRLPRGNRVVVSTKTGEVFDDGLSSYDYSASFLRRSVERSRRELRRDVLDIVFIHSDGRDMWILQETEAVETLLTLKRDGVIRAIGLSGKTVEGADAALAWADAIMVPYNLDDRGHEDVIRRAAARGVGVVVKKALGSGRLDAAESIRFVLENPAVSSAVIGSLSLENMAANVAVAATVSSRS